MPPRSSWLLLWILLTGFTGAVRFDCAIFCLAANQTEAGTCSCSDIWAGAVVQLMAALRLANTHNVEFLVDDDPVFGVVR